MSNVGTTGIGTCVMNHHLRVGYHIDANLVATVQQVVYGKQRIHLGTLDRIISTVNLHERAIRDLVSPDHADSELCHVLIIYPGD